ncbi:hypothetical protein [Porphyromonas sp. COT-052 OH4946]|nr:hypothetical protein [Porphyromonas sp. COT-052 OH4946]
MKKISRHFLPNEGRESELFWCVLPSRQVLGTALPQ